jgi:hypothetical protein
MKILNKAHIEALRKVVPVLEETEQRTVICGSCSGSYLTWNPEQTLLQAYMKHICFFILIIFFTINTNCVVCQMFKVSSFHANTIDNIYWKGTKYMCDISPLSSLTGYKSVYKEYDICEINFGLPMSQDKNYSADWAIIGNMLYLFDVEFICSHDNDKKLNPDNIEKFLNTKFSKELLSRYDYKDEFLKNGVIPAVWFTDTLYIKRFPNQSENWVECDYKCEDFTCLVFDKGRLIKESLVKNIMRFNKSYYPKKKIIVPESNNKIIYSIGTQFIRAPFCIDERNIKKISDNKDKNNHCITITFKNEPEMISLADVYKGENYKNCIYIIDDGVIKTDPTLFMIEKSIICKIEATSSSILKYLTNKDVTIVKIQTEPERDSMAEYGSLLNRLTGNYP